MVSAAVLRPDPVTPAMEGVIDAKEGLPLHHGGVLPAPCMGYRIVGAAEAPLVLAMGGISGLRRLSHDDGGWWSEVVGPGRALDTRRYRVLSVDYLGGSGVSTAPRAGESFPTISAYDQAAMITRLLAELGVPALHGVVGASYGGQVALALGARAPSLVRRLLVISASHRADPMASAWRSVEREIVRFGQRHNDGAGGLKLARALAMCTYRSRREFVQRFSGPPVSNEGRLRLPVEEYLFARGDAYVAKYRPESFVCLSESIDLFTLDPSSVRCPVTAVAVPEDELVPIADMEALVAALPAATLERFESLYGHDAFLKEGERLKPIFKQFLS